MVSEKTVIFDSVNHKEYMARLCGPTAEFFNAKMSGNLEATPLKAQFNSPSFRNRLSVTNIHTVHVTLQYPRHMSPA
jgi:hypothetical protein